MESLYLSVEVRACQFEYILRCLDAIRFSDFNKAPIPPPMCHFTVKLPENVKTPHEFVSSLALNAKGQLAVISSALNLHFCKKFVDYFGC